MVVAAVGEAAGAQMAREIGHQRGQIGHRHLAQAEFLEAGRVDQRRLVRLVEPVPAGVRGGVAAGVQRRRDLADLRGRVRHQQVDQRALAGARGAQHQRGAAGERGQALAGLVGAGLQRHLDDRVTHRGVGRQARARGRGRLAQVGLVQQDVRRNAGVRGGDQRAGELALAEDRLGGDHHQQPVEVGGEGLGLPLVLAVEEVAPGLDGLDHALVAAAVGDLPAHPVTDDAVALLAAGAALDLAALGRLDDVVAAVAGDDAADVEFDGLRHEAGVSARPARRGAPTRAGGNSGSARTPGPASASRHCPGRA